MSIRHRCRGRAVLLAAIIFDSLIAAGAASAGELVDALARRPGTEIFDGLLKQSNLEAKLTAAPYTLFVPVDSAFKALPPTALASLSGPDNAVRLQRFVLFHALRKSLDEEQMAGNEMKVETLAGGSIKIDADDGEILVEHAGLVGKEMRLHDGVVHFIDRVLIPR